MSKAPYSIGDFVHLEVTILPSSKKHSIRAKVIEKLSEFYYTLEYKCPNTGELKKRRLIHSYITGPWQEPTSN